MMARRVAARRPGGWARFILWLRRSLGLSTSSVRRATPPIYAQPAATAPKPSPAAESVAAPIEEDALDFRVTLIDRLEHMLTIAELDNDILLLEMLRDAVVANELDLPRIPALASELLRLRVDGPEDGKRIAELVRRDQDVTARVVQVAGSVLYGMIKVRSLEQAVTRLGISMVREIAVGVSAQNVVYRVPGYDQEARALASAAFECATALHHLARKKGQDTGLAYLSGLFHDVGHVLIYRNLSKLRTRTRGGKPSRLLIDRLIRQLHVPLGAWYAEQRELPKEVARALAHHHGPVDELSGMVWAIQYLMDNPDLMRGRELEEGEWFSHAPRFQHCVDALEMARKSR